MMLTVFADFFLFKVTTTAWLQTPKPLIHQKQSTKLARLHGSRIHALTRKDAFFAVPDLKSV
jgi:hypothetical protein